MKIEINGLYQIKGIEGYYSGLNGNACIVTEINGDDVKVMIWDDPNIYCIDKMYLSKPTLIQYSIENDNMDNLCNSLDHDDNLVWDYLVSNFWSDEEMDHSIASRVSNDNMLRQNCSSEN